MAAHQVIAGALNKGEHVFAVGSVEGIHFTACAVGSDVVVLAPNFERVQVIPGSDDRERLVTSVTCCVDSGKIAATYGELIRIFEPTHSVAEKDAHNLNYRWFETQTIRTAGPISSILWTMEGCRLMVVVGKRLSLFQHRSYSASLTSSRSSAAPVMFCIAEEENKDGDQTSEWDEIWTEELSQPPRHCAFSPDGAFFATSGEDDRFVKVWYQDSPASDGVCGFREEMAMSFALLAHPSAVRGFEWRRTGRYMPRRCIQNALVTWCDDHTARVWKETPPPEASAIDIAGDTDFNVLMERSRKKHGGALSKHFPVKRTRRKIMSRLKSLIPEREKRKKTGSAGEEPATGLRAQMTKVASYSEFNPVLIPGFNVAFHLAATINADTDCLLVPTMENGSRLQKAFTVHWLNNKELVFSQGAEKLLAEALQADTNENGETSPFSAFTSSAFAAHQHAPGPSSRPVSIAFSDYEEDRNDSPDSQTSGNSDDHHGGGGRQDGLSSKDVLDVKLEMLLRQWNRSVDILFTIHPVDGSLVTWTVEYLDDPYRQPSVSFTSRLPGAFPLTDAASLHPTLITFNPHDPVYVEILRRNNNPHVEPGAPLVEKLAEQRAFHTVFLLTKHDNGSLNLWQLSMEEASLFSTILAITHLSRLCGHRFQISKVVAHPVLPLLLSSSQFARDQVDSDKTALEERDSLSEVILWKINPVGPLCKSGGVRELARVAHKHRNAFDYLAWIPAILPSSTLGTVCNSPSSCFIASDGRDLVVYQAVVDARGLLSEIFNADGRGGESPLPQLKEYSNKLPRLRRTPSPMPPLGDSFNIVSTQSTARPGCVLQIGKISSAINAGSSALLVHVFQERLLAGAVDSEVTAAEEAAAVVDRSRDVIFSDRYYVVLLERDDDKDSFVMYSLNLSSQPARCLSTAASPLPSETRDGSGFLRSASPTRPSVANLNVHAENICQQRLPLPQGVRVLTAEPAAGHLSSSSLYPACKAPFLLLTSCSDDVVRFWKCARDEAGHFEWREWRMVSDTLPSELEVDGMIYSVSAAHSGRFACAYDSACQRDESIGGRSTKVEVGVFECESSGGVEWLREDTLTIEDVTFPQLKLPKLEHFGVPSGSRTTLDSIVGDITSRPSQRTANSLPPPFPCSIADSIRRAVSSHTLRAQQLYESLNMREVVRIDWVSTEDGGHILTVGVAANIYLYTKISLDPAQQNIIAMKEAESNMRRPQLRKASSLVTAAPLPKNQLTRWVCTRVVELQSADGLPPIPTCLTWARDGLLIVGMHGEMRCYCQWNLSASSQGSKALQGEKKPTTAPVLPSRKPHASSNSVPTLTISPSHSMLEQLSKKGKEAGNSSAAKHNKIIFDIVHKAMSKECLAQHRDDSLSSEDAVLDAFAQEGLFEASRMANPILPQYHPKQLFVLLNGGRTKRVKAILLHVLRSLKARHPCAANPLSRAASIRRMSTVEGSIDASEQPKVIQADELLHYDEIDDISPLPLYALVAADEQHEQLRTTMDINNSQPTYDSLFLRNEEEDLDTTLDGDDDSVGTGGRSRLQSTCSGDHALDAPGADVVVQVTFTAQHNRELTDLLTHTHLPGVSSVDQMHLLAIADTLSHFSADVIDKLAHANAALHPPPRSAFGEGAAGGYATAAAGIETVDECGLRFLMAMKQHEYLLLCLPPKQKQALRQKGLSSAHVIWAQHSETETELLNAIPAMQKSGATWEDLRALGVAWWIANGSTLRLCVEKLAKDAFQLHQDPLDASIFYLALRKKNILKNLFKTVGNTMMADFFSQDFTTDHWKKAAMKNAFVLMSKQRFQHAAAFFLLGGSLKDAIQTIIAKLGDIQLAMVVLRLYETETDTASAMMRQLLCRDVLGQSVEEFEAGRGRVGDDSGLKKKEASRDPFERSMAYWLLKDYVRAAHTLVDEANSLVNSGEFSLSNIFNFYNYLRKHPLVVRQKLTDAGVQVGSTEKLLVVGRRLEVLLTPAERRLFFRTAAQHMAFGCPMLALDVLSRLPTEMAMLGEGPECLRQMLSEQVEQHQVVPLTPRQAEKVEDVDWGAPSNVVEKDDLALEWSDDDEEEEEEKEKQSTVSETQRKASNPLILENGVADDGSRHVDEKLASTSTSGIVDIIAQHMKFVASLRILTEELSMLAGGFDVRGGQLRYQLFHWLEREINVLKKLCDYRTSEPEHFVDDDGDVFDTSDHTDGSEPTALHEVISKDRALLAARLKIAIQRRRWLNSNQKLIRSFTSFCSLHSAQNHRLTSALMELLLLLLEVQKDSTSAHLSETVPDMHSFPLLVASVSSFKMFVSSPLAFVENQCSDLLASICELAVVPRLDHTIKKTFVLYNLCQGLSSCVYQSLSDVDYYSSVTALSGSGVLTRRTRATTTVDEVRVSTAPSKWPGVENVVSLLGRARDEDAPLLRLLLVECFVAITMSLFSFSLAAYDARWLFRLAAHYINDDQFANVFGGGGEKRLRPAASAPPPRPPRPSVPVESNNVEQKHPAPHEGSTLRSKLNARLHVFGKDGQPSSSTPPGGGSGSAPGRSVEVVPRRPEHASYRWVPPRKNIVQMYAEKVQEEVAGEAASMASESESDDEGGEGKDRREEDDEDNDDDRREHANPNSFAWILMRLALVLQQSVRIKQFLKMAGFEVHEIPSTAPRISEVLALLDGWAYQLREELRQFPGGCPAYLLPISTTEPGEDLGASGPTLRKYRALLEPGNTPFEHEGVAALPVRRLWSYLVRQENLQNIFITHIFAAQGDMKQEVERTGVMANLQKDELPDAFKIIQREHEPIVAFACGQERPGLLVLSTGRELQEMDISAVFDRSSASTWMSNRTELDVALFGLKRDPQKDNDDYQLFVENGAKKSTTLTRMHLTPFIVDRSRKALIKLFKRQISGIRRIDCHPTAPYYATGSSDGSIRVWEWGVGQPLYIPRIAGQHAKVTKLAYAPNGNKLAATDGDGMLSVWQAGLSSDMKAPFFSMKAHSRTTSDVRFIAHAASLLLTAGDSGSGDLNVAVWDTLLPPSQACVHAFAGHPDGSTCALYIQPQQTIISGGAHGEICIWDVRQRALRTTVKAFESTQAVRSLVVDPSFDIIAAGNSDGDIKIYTCESSPHLMYSLPGEHTARGGFSFRQVGQTSVTGVQQLYVDQQMRMFSCGADCSLNLRLIPSVYNLI